MGSSIVGQTHLYMAASAVLASQGQELEKGNHM